jgi:hypothetical protein
MKALPLSDEEIPFLQSKEGFKWHSYKVVLVISYFAKVIWRFPEMVVPLNHPF